MIGLVSTPLSLGVEISKCCRRVDADEVDELESDPDHEPSIAARLPLASLATRLRLVEALALLAACDAVWLSLDACSASSISLLGMPDFLVGVEPT